MQVLDVDKESSGSKQKFCPHSIFSTSAGEGRGSLKCEDDRSLLSQRLWSDILMCLCLNRAPTHTRPQTSGISTKPETFRYLTWSYYTFRLRFDLILTHISLSCYHVTPAAYVLGSENICFLWTCDEFGTSALRRLEHAQYLKHLSVRCGALHSELTFISHCERLQISSFGWYNPCRELVWWTRCRHITRLVKGQ